eukprot:2365259-Rhodomonas_salina.1
MTRACVAESCPRRMSVPDVGKHAGVDECRCRTPGHTQALSHAGAEHSHTHPDPPALTDGLTSSDPHSHTAARPQTLKLSDPQTLRTRDSETPNPRPTPSIHTQPYHTTPQHPPPSTTQRSPLVSVLSPSLSASLPPTALLSSSVPLTHLCQNHIPLVLAPGLGLQPRAERIIERVARQLCDRKRCVAASPTTAVSAALKRSRARHAVCVTDQHAATAKSLEGRLRAMWKDQTSKSGRLGERERRQRARGRETRGTREKSRSKSE